MDEHHCLLCMGSNTNRYAQLSVAREALRTTFPDIHFGEMMETEAVGSGFHSPFSNQLAKFSTTLSPDSVRDLFKELERRSCRKHRSVSFRIRNKDEGCNLMGCIPFFL